MLAEQGAIFICTVSDIAPLKLLLFADQVSPSSLTQVDRQQNRTKKILDFVLVAGPACVSMYLM